MSGGFETILGCSTESWAVLQSVRQVAPKLSGPAGPRGKDWDPNDGRRHRSSESQPFLEEKTANPSFPLGLLSSGSLVSGDGSNSSCAPDCRNAVTTKARTLRYLGVGSPSTVARTPGKDTGLGP